MAKNRSVLTVRDICDAYRTGNLQRRAQLRELYVRLQLEFDAIDAEEDRSRRIAASMSVAYNQQHT